MTLSTAAAWLEKTQAMQHFQAEEGALDLLQEYEDEDDERILHEPRGGQAAGEFVAQARSLEQERRAAARQRQIDIGKARPEYVRYLEIVPKERRRHDQAQTPDPHAAVSKRQFDRQLSEWRRMLHEYDEPGQPQQVSVTKKTGYGGGVVQGIAFASTLGAALRHANSSSEDEVHHYDDAAREEAERAIMNRFEADAQQALEMWEQVYPEFFSGAPARGRTYSEPHGGYAARSSWSGHAAYMGHSDYYDASGAFSHAHQRPRLGSNGDLYGRKLSLESAVGGPPGSWDAAAPSRGALGADGSLGPSAPLPGAPGLGLAAGAGFVPTLPEAPVATAGLWTARPPWGTASAGDVGGTADVAPPPPPDRRSVVLVDASTQSILTGTGLEAKDAWNDLVPTAQPMKIATAESAEKRSAAAVWRTAPGGLSSLDVA